MLYSQPQLYDAIYDRFTEDVDFWVERAAAVTGPVCELGCGTGRITVPLALAGISVTGVDASADMLTSAARRASQAGLDGANPTWKRADMRSAFTRNRYGMAIVPLHSLSHLLSTAEILKCLNAVNTMLETDGLLGLALHNPVPAMLDRDSDALHRIFADISDLPVYESSSYRPDTQILSVNWYVESAEETQKLSYDLRMIFPEEALLLLELSGFELVARFGWYDGSEFGPGSGTQILIARSRSRG